MAARMAFKETYTKIVNKARDTGKKPVWTPSFGWEKSGRETALLTAIQYGRITSGRALALIPESETLALEHDSMELMI